MSQQATASERAAKVQRATNMLQVDPVSEAVASQAYALLEEARETGYDANLVAFYYAKALNVMGRSADAIPYAQSAVDAADASTDRSAFHIQLGLAHMGAGNNAEARAAFEAAKTGAWAGWADHYIRQLPEEGTGG
jgi:tetratricopeptide (TPR) repeat protein